MKTIFISRKLKPQSPFLQLDKEEWLVIGESLIDKKPISPILFPDHNAVFFYSQTAIEIYFKSNLYNPNYKYGVMGEPSHQVFINITNQQADLVGTGNIEYLANCINEEWSEKNILFPTGTTTLHSLEDLLLHKDTKLCKVYKNLPRLDVSLPLINLAFLTSPMNARAFFSTYDLSLPKIYAIGATTASEVYKLTGTEVPFCETPSMSSLYDLAIDEF